MEGRKDNRSVGHESYGQPTDRSAPTEPRRQSGYGMGQIPEGVDWKLAEYLKGPGKLVIGRRQGQAILIGKDGQYNTEIFVAEIVDDLGLPVHGLSVRLAVHTDPKEKILRKELLKRGANRIAGVTETRSSVEPSGITASPDAQGTQEG